MTALYLHHCELITDRGLHAAAARSPAIQKLGLAKEQARPHRPRQAAVVVGPGPCAAQAGMVD
jgi:hypothetical protein